MPASRTFELTDPDAGTILRLSIEAVDHSAEVFYTDENPSFRATIENLSDKPLEGSINAFLGFGTAAGHGRRPAKIDIDVEAGGVGHDMLHFEELLYQDNVLIAVVTNPDRRHMYDEEEEMIRISSPGIGSNHFHALYSFHAWERQYYELNNKIPRKSQEWSKRLVAGVLILAIVQVCLAVVQIFAILGRL